jgi:DNA-binding IclR family transcriptional regulator
MTISTPTSRSRTLARAAEAVIDEVAAEGYTITMTEEELRGFCLAISILAEFAGRKRTLVRRTA